MKLFVKSVLLLGFITITTQDITGKKGCDCSICKGVDNKLNPIVGKNFNDDGGGKSSCTICERKKEMLRMEREKQKQLKKCPFEILGSPAMKGKSSQEIFDEFREQIIPSQNGFFDMMRGVVQTMHVSSVVDLKRAKEKEARELAKKKKEEEEEAKKQKKPHHGRDEILKLNNPVSPKVTVVLKQTPCGQIIPPTHTAEPEKIPLRKRLSEELSRYPPEYLQQLDYPQDFLDLNGNQLLDSDLIDQLINYNMLTEISNQNEQTGSTVSAQREIESSVPEQEVTGSSILQQGLSRSSVPEQEVTGSSILQQGLSRSSVPEQEVTGSSVLEQGLSRSSISEQEVTGSSVPEQKLTGNTAPEQEDTRSTVLKQEETGSSVPEQKETLTESPFVKFVSDEELKALSNKNNIVDYIGLNLLSTSLGVEMNEQNSQSIASSTEPDINLSTQYKTI